MKLAYELGYLPLALDQAGSFIHAQRLRMDEYFPRLSRNYKLVSARKPKANRPYDWTLSSVWAMSLQAIESQNPIARQILSIYALFENEHLDADLFRPLTDYAPLQISNEGKFSSKFSIAC
jgi:hypothetical protein